MIDKNGQSMSSELKKRNASPRLPEPAGVMLNKRPLMVSLLIPFVATSSIL